MVRLSLYWTSSKSRTHPSQILGLMTAQSTGTIGRLRVQVVHEDIRERWYDTVMEISGMFLWSFNSISPIESTVICRRTRDNDGN